MNNIVIVYQILQPAAFGVIRDYKNTTIIPMTH